jgi:hypothetical protein
MSKFLRRRYRITLAMSVLRPFNKIFDKAFSLTEIVFLRSGKENYVYFDLVIVRAALLVYCFSSVYCK